MKADIVEAINGKEILEVRYHEYFRVVEPYAYGRDRSGEEVLRCYQLSGGSSSNERVGWKLLKVSEIYMIRRMRQSFRVRSEYKRNDKAMERIIAQH